VDGVAAYTGIGIARHFEHSLPHDLALALQVAWTQVLQRQSPNLGIGVVCERKKLGQLILGRARPVMGDAQACLGHGSGVSTHDATVFPRTLGRRQ
jgi:hypothetical protein